MALGDGRFGVAIEAVCARETVSVPPRKIYLDFQGHVLSWRFPWPFEHDGRHCLQHVEDAALQG